MNGILLKWLLIIFLIPILTLLFFTRVGGLHALQLESAAVAWVNGASRHWVQAGNGITIPKADVFHNREGLKNDIEVIDPLRELNAIAHSDTESIEELIDDITVWIPRIYYEQFLVYPECIIILETKINAQGRAEVRFGIAMECSDKSKPASPVTI